MQMKKILFIIEGLHGGGAEKALIELLTNFDYERYDVTLCVIYYGGVYMKQIPEPVKVLYLYGEKKDYWHESFRRKTFRYYWKYDSTWLMRMVIRYKMKQQHFDAIISFLEGAPLLFHNMMRHCTDRNIAWVHCDLYNYHWTETVFKTLEREKLHYANMDEIVFVSRNSMNAFGKLYDINVSKQCIYNIIDVDKIHAKALQKNVSNQTFTVIAVGRLAKVKGFDRLLRVAKMFKDNGYHLSFQILGVGEDEQKLLALCDELCVRDCVTFLGFQNPPYPYIKAADVLISTSESEGLPFVICEALVLGTPVVATRTAGSAELLEDGKYGLLTGHDDVSIFDGLKRMVDDSQLRDDFKLKAKVKAETFDVKQTMQKVYHLIEG